MTLSEENYLKAIYHLTTLNGTEVSTNAIAEKMETKASSVTDMLRKLAEKELIHYKKYQGVSLTQTGRLAAKMIVRKHRLWEVFLVEKLAFAWDEVHDIAEQLERLDDFLGNPTEDPHGDPIPDREGRILKTEKQLVSELAEGQEGLCVGVRDTSSEFLQYLDKNGIALGAHITIVGREPFDGSLAIRVDGALHSISGKVAANLFVKPV
jgi:DtxR family transcriptional regulator, Mn-dependent transcriptional regulator